LQQDFSMDHTLSLYVHDTLTLMDPQAPDYALVLLTLAESILEDPDLILHRQLARLKSQAIAEMKMDGLDYNQRMEELEKLEYPKPNREFIYSTFNAFAERHPWVGQENIRPKSIAREMFEEYRSFADYIKVYELQRAEGLLLRHLSGVHKVLTRTVPDSAKNDAVREMELYLGALIRQVDSSLLEEWERMNDPNYRPAGEESPELRPPGWEEAAKDITRNTEAFTAAIRTRIFAFLRALAGSDVDTALSTIPLASETSDSAATSPSDYVRQALDGYLRDHRRIQLDPAARNRRNTYVLPQEDPTHLRVQQMLIDPDEANDWVAEFDVDLEKSRAAGEPSLALMRLGPLAAH
jgi:hypothetical protein